VVDLNQPDHESIEKPVVISVLQVLRSGRAVSSLVFIAHLDRCATGFLLFKSQSDKV